MQAQLFSAEQTEVYEDKRVKATLLFKDDYSTCALITPFGIQQDCCHFFEFQPGNTRVASWDDTKITHHQALRGKYLTIEDNCDRNAVLPFTAKEYPFKILGSHIGRTLENAIEEANPRMDTGELSALFAPIEAEIHSCFPTAHGARQGATQRKLKHVFWDDAYAYCWPYNFRADLARGFLRMFTTYATAHMLNTTEENNRFGYSKRAYEEFKDLPQTRFRCNLRHTSGIVGYAGMLAAAAGTLHLTGLTIAPAIGLIAGETILSALNSVFKGQPTSLIGTLRDFLQAPKTTTKARS